MDESALEGRLLALRQALAMVVAGLDREAILAASDGTVHDGQEDPGAVPSAAYALEQALSEEWRMLRREVEALAGRG